MEEYLAEAPESLGIFQEFIADQGVDTVYRIIDQVLDEARSAETEGIQLDDGEPVSFILAARPDRFDVLMHDGRLGFISMFSLLGLLEERFPE
jgi:hypothetical protein